MKKSISRLLALVLCLALLVPLPVSAADLCFTAINDWVSPLTADTMPVWYGGALYVPYTVFDSGTTGINLGLYCSYSRVSKTVTLFNLNQMLVFDLNTNTCRDDFTGQEFNVRAVIRNGRPYLPVNTVCSFFGLTSSYTAIPQGYLVRIKSSAVVLSDAKFVDAAGDLIERRIREYNQSLEPPPETPPATTPSTPANPTTPQRPAPQPAEDDETPRAEVSTYLALRCETGAQLSAGLDALSGTGRYALFLLTPQVLESEGALARKALGTGHSVGILAEGAGLGETRELLAQGSRLLEQTAHLRTTLALVPDGQRAAIEGEGWVCWTGTLALTPTADTGAAAFAANTLRRLEGRTRATYLTLAGDSAGRVLPTLLRRLADQNFVVSIPMENYL